MTEDFDNTTGLMTITRINPVEDVEKLMEDVDYNNLTILPTRNLVLFPGVTIPLGLIRKSSKTVAQTAFSENKIIGILCQKEADIERPERKDLERYGVFARVLNVLSLPNGTETAIVHALKKFRVIGPSVSPPEQDILSLRVKPINDILPKVHDEEFVASVEAIKQMTQQILDKSNEGNALELSMNLRNMDNPVDIINVIGSMFPFSHNIKMELLISHRIKERANLMVREMAKQEHLIDLTESIKNKARQGLQDQQKNAFLHEQLNVIKEELFGDENDDIRNLHQRLEEKQIVEKTKNIISKEIDKLERLNPQSPDYSVQYNYLDLLLSLPWDSYSTNDISISQAEKTLEEGHFGMEKVKERIIEQLAVIISNPSVKSPIICLVGPPGVGKTSIAKSVAAALGREYQRISLGGVHDEAEIRGHRRTYISAMPGRIIDALKRVNTSNPVLVLDEIDKLSSDYKGDPSSALLEVLDPEQNSHFHDNYIDIDYDLSKVLFIATANTLNTLPQPLIDRMEIIELSGYAIEEKLEIAKRHIIDKVRTELGISNIKSIFSDDALNTLIEFYTRESGVRQMEKNIAKVYRKLIINSLKNEELPAVITAEHISSWLGVSHLGIERFSSIETPGTVTGLAWTPTGGDILYIESTLIPGKEGKLSVTGSLGDVMKESATLALQYVKSNAENLGIDPKIFENKDIHIHVPEGAVPKDGPSAGITIVTSLVSLLLNKKVRDNLAMTGEITLRGKVLPVGGIKEKILAARRSGITYIILSSENRKDVEEIPSDYLKGIDFIYVKNIREVLTHSF